MGSTFLKCHRLLIPQLATLYGIQFHTAVVCNPASFLQLTASLISWVFHDLGKTEAILKGLPDTLYQRASTRSTYISTWLSERISVWVIPSVFSYTYFPLEVKAEYFHSRSFEGVTLSNIITPFQVNHPHLLLCACVLCKKLSLYMLYANFQLMFNFSYIFTFYKQVYFIIEKQAVVKQAKVTQSRLLSLVLLFLFCTLP